MESKNKIVNITTLEKGENLGYGKYEVDEDVWDGISPIGYGG